MDLQGSTTKLRQLRQQLGLGLNHVAAQTGVPAATLSKIERRLTTAHPRQAAALVVFFQGQISELEILYPDRALPPPRRARASLVHSVAINN